MAIWDFSEYTLDELTEVSRLIRKLENLGFDIIDSDALSEIHSEIEKKERAILNE